IIRCTHVCTLFYTLKRTYIPLKEVMYMYKNDSNLIKVEETVKIPVYSSVKTVNGRLIYEFDRFEDVPVEFLANKDNSNRKDHYKWLVIKDAAIILFCWLWNWVMMGGADAESVQKLFA